MPGPQGEQGGGGEEAGGEALEAPPIQLPVTRDRIKKLQNFGPTDPGADRHPVRWPYWFLQVVCGDARARKRPLLLLGATISMDLFGDAHIPSKRVTTINYLVIILKHSSKTIDWVRLMA